MGCHGGRSFTGTLEIGADAASAIADSAQPASARPQREANRICTDAECGHRFMATLCMTASEARARSSAITFCRNGLCSSAPLAPLFPPSPGVAHPIDLAGPPHGRVFVTKSDGAPGGDAVRVDLHGAGWAESDVREGDWYDIMIRSNDGATLAALHQAARVEVRYPNGPSCTPACPTIRMESLCDGP